MRKKNENLTHLEIYVNFYSPVGMVTSKDQESDKFWGMKQGADEYLTKPFKPEDLLKAVNKYI